MFWSIHERVREICPHPHLLISMLLTTISNNKLDIMASNTKKRLAFEMSKSPGPTMNDLEIIALA